MSTWSVVDGDVEDVEDVDRDRGRRTGGSGTPTVTASAGNVARHRSRRGSITSMIMPEGDREIVA